MSFIKFIHIPTFALSFLLGVVAVYMYNNDQIRKVYVYPTPENIKKLQYKDATENCFEFRQKEVNCPANNKSNKIPVQS
jgi:hypothetical protein